MAMPYPERAGTPDDHRRAKCRPETPGARVVNTLAEEAESLQAGDSQMRGLALEYLETAVPPDVSALLMDAIEHPSGPGDLRVGEAA